MKVTEQAENFLWFLVLLIEVSVFCMLLCGCKSQLVPEYHEVFVHRQDSTSRRDSIFVRDSICIVQRGDTVFVERHNIVFRDRWRDRLRVDSFIQRDTVSVVRELEKPLGWWQRTKMQLGVTLLWMLGAAVAWIVIRFKFRIGKL